MTAAWWLGKRVIVDIGALHVDATVVDATLRYDRIFLLVTVAGQGQQWVTADRVMIPTATEVA